MSIDGALLLPWYEADFLRKVETYKESKRYRELNTTGGYYSEEDMKKKVSEGGLGLNAILSCPVCFTAVVRVTNDILNSINPLACTIVNCKLSPLSQEARGEDHQVARGQPGSDEAQHGKVLEPNSAEHYVSHPYPSTTHKKVAV